MNLRNLIKWSALFLALLAYKQYEAEEIKTLSGTPALEQHVSLAPHGDR